MIPLAVMVGGALGSVARYGVGLAAARAMGQGFPWGTVLINIVGSFVIGLFASLSVRGSLSDVSRAFVMVGLCGGFTTFSAFSLQTIELLRAGYGGRAMLNVAASVLLCLAATALGIRLAPV
jgi:CrcB protein